jgi:haloalkane dehalogenase
MEPTTLPAAPERRVLGLTLRSVSLDSGKISYVDEGAGPPIVLLHGAPLTGLGFFRVIRELKGRYRVIAPDLPGFGYSTRALHFDGTLSSYARCVEEFCRALDLKGFYVYLNDSSGCIGFAALARLADRVAGIVVADTVPLPLTGPAFLVKFALKYVIGSRFVRFLNRRLNLLPWLVATVAPFLRPFSREERAVLAGQFETHEKRDRVLDVFGQMDNDDAFMRLAATSARERLAHIPALLLFGQFDPMRFIGVSHYERLFRRSAVRIVPFEEHFPILASGKRVAEAVDQWIAHLDAPVPRTATVQQQGATV